VFDPEPPQFPCAQGQHRYAEELCSLPLCRPSRRRHFRKATLSTKHLGLFVANKIYSSASDLNYGEAV
jgi:hypothetical protein